MIPNEQQPKDKLELWFVDFVATTRPAHAQEGTYAPAKHHKKIEHPFRNASLASASNQLVITIGCQRDDIDSNIPRKNEIAWQLKPEEEGGEAKGEEDGSEPKRPFFHQ